MHKYKYNTITYCIRNWDKFEGLLGVGDYEGLSSDHLKYLFIPFILFVKILQLSLYEACT